MFLGLFISLLCVRKYQNNIVEGKVVNDFSWMPTAAVVVLSIYVRFAIRNDNSRWPFIFHMQGQ